MSFPIKNGDFPVRYVKLPEGIDRLSLPIQVLHSWRLRSPGSAEFKERTVEARRAELGFAAKRRVNFATSSE